MRAIFLMLSASLVLTGCGAFTGDPGPAGAPGADGKDGMPGAMGVDGKDSTVSGSRIRAVYRTSEDGAREAIGWFDKDLDTQCAFSTATDGKTRCLPIIGEFTGAVFLYPGMGCTDEPVAIGFPHDEACQVSVSYVPSRVKGKCGYSTAVYAVGAKYTGPGATVYSNLDRSSGNCFDSIQSMFEKFNMAVMDPSSFVEATDE